MRNSIVALCFMASSVIASPLTTEYKAIDVPEHIYGGGWEHFVGGGVATFDCNGDQRPELYVAGGENPAQLMINISDKDVLFRANTPDQLALRGVIGAYPLDINHDGFLDLAVLRVGPDLIFQGDGACGFTVFDGLGFESPDAWTTAFSATWEQGNDLPTLAFGTYVDRNNPDGPFQACDDLRLYRPEGDKYAAPRRLAPSYCTLSILFSDWNRNGQADLRVSNDRHYYVKGGQEQLWSMRSEPELYEVNDGWLPYSIWGMGIASRDISGDGFPELYLTSMGDQKFQQFDPTNGTPTWRDVTYEFGTTAHRPHAGDDGRPSTGWHAQFGDIDNDGRDDIFVSKGNVEQMPDAAMQDPNSLLLQKEDGQFFDASVQLGVATMDRSRGAALVDLNLDGALDLVVVNRRANLEIYQNKQTTGNWLLVTVSQAGPNSQAIGGFIELRTSLGVQTRELTIGGGHAGGSAGAHHFGLGADTSVDIRMIWPSGAKGAWQTVQTNQILNLEK